ncbi:MAG: hypothetical protein PHE53_05160 [Thermoguttaceae bacterium]|nr:hypothetical protein [Thermoguttaceae bacterium]
MPMMFDGCVCCAEWIEPACVQRFRGVPLLFVMLWAAVCGVTKWNGWGRLFGRFFMRWFGRMVEVLFFTVLGSRLDAQKMVYSRMSLRSFQWLELSVFTNFCGLRAVGRFVEIASVRIVRTGIGKFR